jgi:hypothetical protein
MKLGNIEKAKEYKARLDAIKNWLYLIPIVLKLPQQGQFFF